jgi:hypothetical protein
MHRRRSALSKGITRPDRWSNRRSQPRRLCPVEILEGRELPSTFTVTSQSGAGIGSLRQAIIAANHHPGPDTIDFSVSGTIRVGRQSLPAINGPVTIDGTSAPTFAGSPVITVNFQGTRGLRFAAGSDGSTLKSLALVRAGDAGVTLIASNITVQGNDIGLPANGSSPAGNRGDGIRIDASSHGDLIGQLDPVSGVTYYDADSVSIQPVTAWTGIRAGTTPGQYLLTGTSGTSGLLYIGPVSGSSGTSYLVNYPGASVTSPYGPDVVGPDITGANVLRLVGTYNTSGSSAVNGFIFQGTTTDLSNAADYETIDYPGVTYTYVHSTMGDLAVGNAGDIPDSTDHAFIDSLSQHTFLATDIAYPGSQTTGTSVYGVWYNGGTSYTIAGGYNTVGKPGGPAAEGFLVDYDEATGQFSNWTSYAGPQGLVGSSVATHFQGISSPEPGIYTMSASSTDATSSTVFEASLATVRRNPDGTFSPAYWVSLNYPGAVGIESANSVAGNQVVGIATTSTGTVAFQATVDLAFQLSNVISGNGGNGIGIYGASGNRIAMNNIGTDATGTFNRGNAKDGILLTRGASNNVIGGTVSAGNDPTAGTIVRPPQGNLISGNGGSGVMITGGAAGNTLSANFIGTTADGNSALGNRHDGVAVVRASGNSLIGCTLQDQPFVYYNVLSGNGGNGLRIVNSNDTTVQANFLGVGANNATVVANHGDGLLVSGSSQGTQVGGVIPLGNVISGNDQNGIEVAGRASGFTSFNTFGGVFAFGGAAPNRRDGILITSSGGDNLIRTCIISGNEGNGIELGGRATGVQVTQTATGTNTSLNAPIPNGGDGIKIDGRAHDDAIGGFQPSVEPATTVSSNDRFGIEVTGHARDIAIFHADIGTSGLGTQPLPNTMGGIAIGPGTAFTAIGGAAQPFQDLVRYNNGPGVFIHSSRDNAVLEDQIQWNAGPGVLVTGRSANTVVMGNAISGNTGDGVTLMRARKVRIGGNSTGVGSSNTAAFGQGNRIVANIGYGLYAAGACNGSVVQGNTILANSQGNVNITRARGITYVP